MVIENLHFVLQAIAGIGIAGFLIGLSALAVLVRERDRKEMSDTLSRFAAMHELARQLELVKNLKAIVAHWEEHERMNGSQKGTRFPRRPKATRHEQSDQETFNLPPTPKKGDGNTIRAAVEDLVEKRPGITSTEAVNALLGKVALTSSDPRKLISTRIGQFVKARRIRRDGNKLYPVELPF